MAQQIEPQYLEYLRLCKKRGYGTLSYEDTRWYAEYAKMYINE